MNRIKYFTSESYKEGWKKKSLLFSSVASITDQFFLGVGFLFFFSFTFKRTCIIAQWAFIEEKIGKISKVIRITTMKFDFYFGLVLVSIPDTPNGFFVSLKHLNVVHIWLPIFDVPAMVSSHHPDIIVRPYHATDRAVVSLFMSWKN
jgi:hypothetical protein